MNFKFNEENLGLSQDQIDHLINKVESVELNLQTFFETIDEDKSISFAEILKVICSSNLTKEEFEFMVTSLIFNDFINNVPEDDQTQKLLDLIDELSKNEENDAV
jgi:hypothetical protein